ncbi:hypothetical protein [Pseudonocardia aurantiaca]|uniref:Uncharacterized protein n=1 Tax=Pseudonocardia aurantiaca TaxID=75290 RepID=A0ABW4FMX7_9PSEU
MEEAQRLIDAHEPPELLVYSVQVADTGIGTDLPPPSPRRRRD